MCSEERWGILKRLSNIQVAPNSTALSAICVVQVYYQVIACITIPVRSYQHCVRYNPDDATVRASEVVLNPDKLQQINYSQQRS